MSEIKRIVYFGAGFLLRFGLLQSGLFGLTERPEFATPLNSYKRLREGIHLAGESAADPYSGVLFHETPIALLFFRFLFSNFSQRFVDIFFVLIDLFTASLLGEVGRLVAAKLIKTQEKEKKGYHKDAAEILLKLEDVASMGRQVEVAYCFHPYLIGNCAARTTTVFANLVMALFLVASLRGQAAMAGLFLALATYQSFYPVMLLVPMVMILHDSKMSFREAVQSSLPFLLWLSALYYASYVMMGESTSFIVSTTGFILSVPELTPNMGLFWYFFIEMFEHFRVFFVCTFQLNCFVYVYPLASRLKSQPYLLAYSLLALTAVFKSYPSYGDVGFYTALLPTVGYLLPYMKQNFIVANMFLATTILGPIMYQLWIYNGSANANFFFAITLVFGTAQIFLITDILFAYVKREFYLNKGFKALKPTESGVVPTLKLS